jgi:hypothetical protein
MQATAHGRRARARPFLVPELQPPEPAKKGGRPQQREPHAHADTALPLARTVPKTGLGDETRATLPAEDHATRRNLFPRLFISGVSDTVLRFFSLRRL